MNLQHKNFEFIESIVLFVGAALIGNIHIIAGAFSFICVGCYHIVKIYKELKK